MSRLIRSLLLLLPTLTMVPALAQLGGQSSFRILDIPSSARISALGGSPIAVYDNDLNVGLFNPALLNASMGRQVALSYLPYMDGVDIGYASYSHHADSIRTTFAATVQYVDYGTAPRTDESGLEFGTFSANEFVIQLGAGHPIDSVFSIGANVKFIGSQMDSYNSTAWAVDVGGVFFKRKYNLVVSALLRHMGFQASSFTDTKEKLPFQAQLAATYKFRHAPFRLGLSLDNLQRWDLTYEDPNQPAQIDPATGQVVEDKVTFLDKAKLHVVPHVEILLSENFMLRLAYNVRRREELRFDAKPGLTGLSFGAGLKVSKLHVSYAFAKFHVAGASNTITLALRFADLRREG
ncbi:MAG: type IX secretion system protein PorQ [Flavobacteriales bacterium]|nr:type IX secretion system protein PorQ [Flavobacteriales bacterium]